MPRLPRVHLENALYFVSMEGPYREQIFKDQADRLKYMELLDRYKAEYGFKLFSYALLRDRLHLLVEADEQFPISQIMQKVTPLYTKYFNVRYNRKGPLFQKRFRSVMVEKDGYLGRVTHYLETIAAGSVPVTPEEKQEFEFLDKKLSRGFFLGSDRFISEAKKKMEKQIQKDNSFAEPLAGGAGSSLPAFSLSGKTAVLSGLLVATICLSVFSAYLRQESFVTLVRTMALAGRPIPQKAAAKPAELKLPTPRQVAGLNGTIWEVELISVSPDGVETPVKDKIKFQGEAFESYYFASQGFSPSNYTVTVNESGVITWETIQRNTKGEVVSWRGDWNGKQMEGILSYRSEGSNPRDFSFISGPLLRQK